MELFADDQSESLFLSEADKADIEKLKEISIRAYDAVNLALMNSLVKADVKLYTNRVLNAAEKAVQLMYKSPACSKTQVQLKEREAADRAASDRGEQAVREVLDAAHKAGHEIHKLCGFLRFIPVTMSERDELSDKSNDYYLAHCAPDNFILPALAEHFETRFGGMAWAIIDEKRNYILIRRKNKIPSLENFHTDNGEPRFSFKTLDEDSADYEQLWRLYNRIIVIDNRRNKKLQRQFVPVRYRKYLTEFQ